MRTKTTLVLPTLAVWGLLSLTAGACGGAAPGSSTSAAGPPAAVVSPQLARLDDGVRQPIEAALGRIAEAPEDARLRVELGMLYQANGLGESVEEAYAQALALDPSLPRPWYYLALYRQSRGDVGAALEACREAVERAPGYVAARRKLGALLLDLGRTEDALAAYEEARTMEPDNVANAVGAARAHLQLRDWQAAAELLEGAVAKEPRFGYAQALLGRAYLGLGREEEARIAASRGRGAAPPAFDPWAAELATWRGGYKGAMRRAEHLFGEGKDDEAIRELVRMREEYPDDPMVLSNLAAAYSRKGQVDSMLAVLGQALELDPDHYPTHLNLSHGYLTKGDADRALEHARRAVELNPWMAAPYTQLAEVQVALGERAEARSSLERAIELQGDVARTRLRLADLLYEDGAYVEAARAYEGVTVASPSSVRAYHGLALSLARAGRPAEARAALDAARRVSAQHKNHAALERAVLESEGLVDE